MNLYHKTFATLSGVVLAGLMISAAYAGDGKGGAKDGYSVQKGGHRLLGICRDCGCRNDCDAVCRLKKEPLTKKVTCWASEKEPICLPGPSKRGCRHFTRASCDDGKVGMKDCCPRKNANSKKIVWYEWCVPGVDKNGDSECSHTCTRKKLMRKEIDVPIKGAYKYSWETVKLCKNCAGKYDTAPGPEEANADIPEPPPVDARILYGKPVFEKMVSYTR